VTPKQVLPKFVSGSGRIRVPKSGQIRLRSDLKSNLVQPFFTKLIFVRTCNTITDGGEYRQLIIRPTWCNAVDESANSTTVVPVRSEVSDRLVRLFILHPAEKSLFRRLFVFLSTHTVLVIIPDRHRDGVVKDQSPYESED